MSTQLTNAFTHSVDLSRDLLALNLSASQAFFRCQLDQAHTLLAQSREHLLAALSNTAQETPLQWFETLQATLSQVGETG